MAANQVVQHNGLITPLKKVLAHVRTDIAGTTHNENILPHDNINLQGSWLILDSIVTPALPINRDGEGSFQTQDLGRWHAMFEQGLINGIPRVNGSDNDFVVVQRVQDRRTSNRMPQ